MIKACVIGAGSWGVALSTVLSDNGHEVTVWSALEDEIKMLSEKREHISKLPGVKLSEATEFTTDLAAAVGDKDLIIMAVPSPFVRSTARQMKPLVPQGQLIVDVAKGIEESSLLPMTEVIKEEIPQAEAAILSGPSHAEEVGRRLPTTIVVGSHSRAAAEFIQDTFMNPNFRVYTSPDVLGIGLGGSLKNVIALAAGMADGLGCGDNTKAALITRGIRELAAIGKAAGAASETLLGLSGLGDLIVTCASVHSRNRKAGQLMGQGYTMEQAMEEVQMIVEGVYSAKAGLQLGEKYGLSLPIIEAVNHILFEGMTVRDGVMGLMQRERKSEETSLSWESR
ncbi:MAG: NAD(P)-dependent glycerol-3-phosphate dehydrogenase [Lachnospiraceae bacterium]|nr:NAD(P)-dependent glycerol-3-phosphate dehydrogenase [Lachnospiraceae bacterium]